jgi:hypothetical protein
MREITGPSTVVNTILTWTIPPLLTAASIGVGYLSVALVPGEIPDDETLLTRALDVLLFGLVLVGCGACFVWHRSAPFTALGVIVALWYYSDLYLHRSTDPLGGLVYFATIPLAALCAVCGLVGFFSGRKRARQKRAVLADRGAVS